MMKQIIHFQHIKGILKAYERLITYPYGLYRCTGNFILQYYWEYFVIFCLSLYRAWCIYRTITKGSYETVEGRCTAVMPKVLRKYCKIRVMDTNGNESTLMLDKRSIIKIGHKYRFYFRNTQRMTFGNTYLDSYLPLDYFLGYEELDLPDKHEVE